MVSKFKQWFSGDAKLRYFVIAAIITSLLASFCISVGIAGPIFFENRLRQQVEMEVVVDSPEAQGYATWRSNKSPESPERRFNFYIFHVSNPAEVIAGGTPYMMEVPLPFLFTPSKSGPYSYKVFYEYLNISFSQNGNEVSYRKWQYFVFDAQSSFGGAKPEQDAYVVVNVPFQMVFGNWLWEAPETPWWRVLAFDIMASAAHSQLFVNRFEDIYPFTFQGPPTRSSLDTKTQY